jgi:hypothetical protein
MGDEGVRCGHCGFEVLVTRVEGQTITRIDMLPFMATCRRAKDLPAYSKECPELQRSLAGQSESHPGTQGGHQ